MVLYEVQLYMESGRGNEALKHLEDYKGLISDQLAYYEVKGVGVRGCGCGLEWWVGPIGQILLEKKDFPEAESTFHFLLSRNPENYSYYENLEKCLDLRMLPWQPWLPWQTRAMTSFVTIATEEMQLELYDALQGEFPRSHVCKRIPLGIASGCGFRERMDKYLRPPLHKGVPSLFVGLKSLYKDEEKVTCYLCI